MQTTITTKGIDRKIPRFYFVMGSRISSRSLYIAKYIPEYFVKPDQAITRVEEKKCASSQK